MQRRLRVSLTRTHITDEYYLWSTVKIIYFMEDFFVKSFNKLWRLINRSIHVSRIFWHTYTDSSDCVIGINVRQGLLWRVGGTIDLRVHRYVDRNVSSVQRSTVSSRWSETATLSPRPASDFAQWTNNQFITYRRKSTEYHNSKMERNLQ